jgi:hypothetical protein
MHRVGRRPTSANLTLYYEDKKLSARVSTAFQIFGACAVLESVCVQ